MLRVLAGVALATLAVTTGPAVADPLTDVRHEGGCEFDTVAQAALGQDVYRGVVFARVVAFSLAPERNPVTITGLRCELRVNDTARQSWTGRVAGPAGVLEPTPVEYVAGDADRVDLCTILDTKDAVGVTASETSCSDTAPRCPPEGFCGDEWVLDAVFTVADETVCPRTGGDLYVAGELVYDCPPYAGY